MKYEITFEDLEGNEIPVPNPDITWRVAQIWADFDVDHEGTIGFTLRIKPARMQFITQPGHGEIVVVEEGQQMPLHEIVDELFRKVIESDEFDGLTPRERDHVLFELIKKAQAYIDDKDNH